MHVPLIYLPLYYPFKTTVLGEGSVTDGLRRYSEDVRGVMTVRRALLSASMRPCSSPHRGPHSHRLPCRVPPPTYCSCAHVESSRGGLTLCALIVVWQTYWSMWPPVHLLSFTVIPQELRISFVACVSFVWLVYLSNASHQHHEHDADGK